MLIPVATLVGAELHYIYTYTDLHTLLDEYGANLSLIHYLTKDMRDMPNDKQHSSLQHLIQDMMRLGNIDSVLLEPVNFFLGKVGLPYIGDYIHNITSQPGIPDMHDTPLYLTSNWYTSCQ
jgi:hypothetical protein